jgi:ABC-type sulfate/molybdate transport systems ATPase subunit
MPVKRYSSGMFARLGFSVASHVDSDILLVDEVLSVGDYMFQRKCLERMRSVISSGTTVIFVSHNLREVANLCERSLLLEKGSIQMIGPTEDVIQTYFSRGQQQRTVEPDKEIFITKVTTQNGDRPCSEFASGSKMRITVQASACARHDDISVVIQLVDNHQYPFFDTCTQRLGAAPITIEAGQTLECTFELDLDLAQGTFHVNAYLHRYVTDQPCDRWISAATFFVNGAPDVRGIVTLHPKLLPMDSELIQCSHHVQSL